MSVSTIPPSQLAMAQGSEELDYLDYIVQRADRFAGSGGFAAFYRGLSELEAERVERIWRCALALETGDEALVAAEAEILVRAMPDEDDGEGALVARTFSEALLARTRGLEGAGGNLYLEARPPGAQLRAFELLRLRTPLIPFAYAASNRALNELMNGSSVVTLIDIGIGRGGQIRALLKHPSARRAFGELHIVGVEPDSLDNGVGALQRAKSEILQAAFSLGIPATFHAIAKRAEDLVPDDFAQAGLRGRVVANAAFALHHVGVGEPDRLDRVGVLRLLRTVGVEGVVLAEPDTDHFSDVFRARFLHAYRHYRTVARSLRAMLAPSDAALVWQEFFAPEVRNVITFEGTRRTERHQEGTAWAAALQAGGWSVDRSLPDFVPRAAAPPGFAVHNRGAIFSLAYGGVDLLSIVRGRI